MYTPTEIIAEAARLWHVNPLDISGRSRNRNIVRARQAAAWALRSCTDLSLTAIGELLDRDHTTVLYSLETIERESRSDPWLKERLGRLSIVAMSVALERRNPIVDQWLTEAGL